MKAVREAIRTRLLADTTLTAMLASPQAVYYDRAPTVTAARPYVVFFRSSRRDQWTFGGDSLIWQKWTVKGVADQQGQAEDIDERCQQVLNGAELTVTGETCLFLLSSSGLSFTEEDGAERIQHVGTIYDLTTERGSS